MYPLEKLWGLVVSLLHTGQNPGRWLENKKSLTLAESSNWTLNQESIFLTSSVSPVVEEFHVKTTCEWVIFLLFFTDLLKPEAKSYVCMSPFYFSPSILIKDHFDDHSDLSITNMSFIVIKSLFNLVLFTFTMIS